MFTVKVENFLTKYIIPRFLKSEDFESIQVTIKGYMFFILIMLKNPVLNFNKNILWFVRKHRNLESVVGVVPHLSKSSFKFQFQFVTIR